MLEQPPAAREGAEASERLVAASSHFVPHREDERASLALAAGGGFKRGSIVGATDKLGEQVTDKFYKVESFGRTLYHLLGIDPDKQVETFSGRPIKLIAEDAPLVKEALV